MSFPGVRRARWVGALSVFLGGVIGTMLRAGVDLIFTGGELSPTTLLACNVIGSFILGFLLRAIEMRGAETESMRRFRLFTGTGIIGGFTSYSSLAFISGYFLLGPTPIAGAFYAALSVVAGIAAALIGSMIVPRRRGGGEQP